MSIDLMGFFLKKLERLAAMLKVAEFEEKKYIITGFWLRLLICFGNEPIGRCFWGGDQYRGLIHLKEAAQCEFNVYG